MKLDSAKLADIRSNMIVVSVALIVLCLPMTALLTWLNVETWAAGLFTLVNSLIGVPLGCAAGIAMGILAGRGKGIPSNILGIVLFIVCSLIYEGICQFLYKYAPPMGGFFESKVTFVVAIGFILAAVRSSNSIRAKKPLLDEETGDEGLVE